MIGSKSHHPSGKIGHQGFTLIEILIALVLLGISVAVLSQLFSTNLRNISKSQNYVPAVVFAEAKMSEILAKDYLDENTETYKTDDGYSLDVSISEAMKDRFQVLPVKLMEIVLNVHWRVDQQEKTFVLKTYKTVRRSLLPEPTEKKEEEQQQEQKQEQK